MAGNNFLSRNRIAELTRAMAEPDPFGERAAPDNPFDQKTSSEGHDETTAPDDGEAHPDWNSHKEQLAEFSGVRRRGVVLIIAMTGLALLGTAGVFGYREIWDRWHRTHQLPNSAVL